jgi:outer membrane lipoprotein SlyB
MDTNIKKLHPLLTIAAISVTLFSAVGVAALTGVIPHSKGQTNDAAPVVAQAPAAEPMPAPQAAPAPEATPAPQPAKKHVAKKHVPVKVATVETPAMTPPASVPVAQAPQPIEAPKPVVKPGRFGTVAAVREVELKGDAKGVGAVGGGLAGAVLGHNIGDHNKIVTVLGAAGGALLGNQIEKTARATKQWELTVNFDDGSNEVVKSATQPVWHQGDRVRLYEGTLQPV